MRILVIGGTQFFGKHFVEAALERGDEVTIFSRGRRRPAFFDRIQHVAGDRKDHRAFLAALAGREFDLVVDNIAFSRPDVDAAVEAFRGRIGHYVMTSSGAVYPDFEPPAILRPVVEDDADLSLRGDGAYSEGKRECEQVLLERQPFPFTIFRPPIVQGPDDSSTRGWFWYQRIADGRPVLVPERYPVPLWRQAYSRDIARAFLLAVGGPAARGKTYNIASDEIVTLGEFVRLAAETLGRPDPGVSVPRDLLKEQAPWYKPTFLHRFVMDISKIKSDLAFRPTPFTRWLDETIRWHLRAGLPNSPGYEHRADEVALARRVRGEGTVR